MAAHHDTMREKLGEAQLLDVDTVIIPVWVAEAFLKVAGDVSGDIAKAMIWHRYQSSEFGSGKIYAIKALRSATGYSLKDSEEIIEDALAEAERFFKERQNGINI